MRHLLLIGGGRGREPIDHGADGQHLHDLRHERPALRTIGKTANDGREGAAAESLEGAVQLPTDVVANLG